MYCDDFICKHSDNGICFLFDVACMGHDICCMDCTVCLFGASGDCDVQAKPSRCDDVPDLPPEGYIV